MRRRNQVNPGGNPYVCPKKSCEKNQISYGHLLVADRFQRRGPHFPEVRVGKTASSSFDSLNIKASSGPD
jgi:hypothetical protein